MKRTTKVEEIKRMYESTDQMDIKPLMQPLVMYVMHQSGASSREIGEVFGISRQSVDYRLKKIKAELDNV